MTARMATSISILTSIGAAILEMMLMLMPMLVCKETRAMLSTLTSQALMRMTSRSRCQVTWMKVMSISVLLNESFMSCGLLLYELVISVA